MWRKSSTAKGGRGLAGIHDVKERAMQAAATLTQKRQIVDLDWPRCHSRETGKPELECGCLRVSR